jgi:hypothetical protein
MALMSAQSNRGIILSGEFRFPIALRHGRPPPLPMQRRLKSIHDPECYAYPKLLQQHFGSIGESDRITIRATVSPDERCILRCLDAIRPLKILGNALDPQLGIGRQTNGSVAVTWDRQSD